MNVTLEEADRLNEAGKLDEAERMYEVLLAHYPTHLQVLCNAALLFMRRKRFGVATALLEACLKLEKRADILSNLSIAYRSTGQQEKYKQCLEESMSLSPTPECMANYASMHIESNKQVDAIEKCEEAIKQKPDLAIAHWNLSLALLGQGVWERAWDEYEWGIKISEMRGERKAEGIDIPVWDGKSKGKLWVWGEQGIGDEIMFASMIPEIHGCQLIIECHERLETLMKKSFPDATVYPTREKSVVQWVTKEKPDYRIGMGSLGKFYRRSKESFPGTPYLKADPLPKGEKFRVGISWTGGFKPGRIAKRTVPLPWWGPILSTPRVEFVSLQYTECSDEIGVMSALGYDIKVMDEYVKAKDYYETARLVKSCDLVISCCTSVIHLAGALGVPCWVMAPKFPAWRYGMKGPMPWYRSVRLYRQLEENNWKPVISNVGLDLDELVNGKIEVAA